MAQSPSDDETAVTENFVDHVFEDAPSIDANSLPDLRDALEQRLADCAAQHPPVWFLSELRSLLFEFSDIFRLSLCSDPPVKVTPLLLKQSPDAVPLLANARILSPVARSYLRSWVAELEKCGLIYSNRNPSWALQAFVVDPFKKPRMVIDMVPANKSMVEYYFPLPHLQSFGYKIRLCISLWIASKVIGNFPSKEISTAKAL